MSKQKWRIGAKLPNSTRDLLLRVFPPVLDDVYCYTVTWAYGVTDEFRDWPVGDLEAIVYGRHLLEGQHDSLMVVVGGRRFQPSGQRLHVTLSTAAGRAPALGEHITDKHITPVDHLTFPVRFERLPLWRIQPEPNRSRRAA